MVGPLMLMKLLHCRQLRSQKNVIKTTPIEDTCINRNPDNNNKDYETCRVCLKPGDIPIFNIGVEDISIDLKTFGDIDVRADDSYPKQLCNSCHALLQGAILFRKTAQESDAILKQPVESKVDSDDDVMDYADVSYDKEEETQKQNQLHCKKCELSFETFQEYCDHRLSLEHENFRKTCTICNKSYSARYYKKHIAIHTLEQTLMCDVCGKHFIMKGPLTRHRLTHFSDLPFKCSLCPYKGRFPEALKMHMRSHTGEKPYQCSKCPAQCVSKSNLNRHMLRHEEERNYKCEICVKGFHVQRDLDLHFKVDHTGIKDHVCGICSKAFGYKKQLRKHELKVHKREKLLHGRTPLYIKYGGIMKDQRQLTSED